MRTRSRPPGTSFVARRPTLPMALPLALVMTTGGCGPAVRRDLSRIPQRQITFDDQCHLQDFFDQRNAASARPLRVIDEQSTESQDTEPDEHGHPRRVMVGDGTYAVAGRSLRRRFRQLLSEEYERVPDELTDPNVREFRVRVEWWASGQMRRLRPDREIEIETDRNGKVTLPFHPCVGEFLFGAPVYGMRRTFLQADSARAHGELPPPVRATDEQTTDLRTPPTLPDVPQDGGIAPTAPAPTATQDGGTAGSVDASIR